MIALNSKYLRLSDLRRLRNLLFVSRRAVEGLYAGRHASPQRGHSVEFNDYRQYMPGDEIGDVDWKVFGRSDKLFVKLFEQQSDMTVHLLVDASASMDYGKGQGSGAEGQGEEKRKAQRTSNSAWPLAPGPRPFSKYDHACAMAAAVAFLATRQQDKVSLAIAQNGLAQFLRPVGSFAHLRSILALMEETQPRGEARLAQALMDMAGRVGRRGVLVVFSDLLDEPEPIQKALSIYTHRGGEVIVFHVLHDHELHLQSVAVGDALFHDSETAARLALNVDDIRPAYEQKLRAFLNHWSTTCRARGIDYHRVSTATDAYRALEQYLVSRASTA